LIKKKNQKHMMTGMLPYRPRSAVVGPTCAELEADMKRPSGGEDEDEDRGDGGTDAVDLEKEIWDRFFAGGY
jgi:hypothetical protein